VNILIKILVETWHVLLEMSPYLLFGFLLAGVLKVLIPNRLLYKHLAKSTFFSIVKASILGVPLPLCSCGIIPLAAHLKKEGANRGSVISFLTSTPTTGVDSIFATYALMGPIFAIMRPIVALISGIFSGAMEFLLGKKEATEINSNPDFSCSVCDDNDPHVHTLFEKSRYIVHYAFIELIEDLGKWLAIGVVLSGIISGLIPANLAEAYLSNPIMAYLLMIVIGLPLYVCSTGSIPIAASFIKIGISPGAALIFLIAGPATNAATISFVGGKFGKRSLAIYLLSIAIISILSGFFLDTFFSSTAIAHSMKHLHENGLPFSIQLISALIFIMLLLRVFVKKYFVKKKKSSCCGDNH
jgi:uncharacterized membrane protein YraQ (UPF0718 family)